MAGSSRLVTRMSLGQKEKDPVADDEVRRRCMAGAHDAEAGEPHRSSRAKNMTSREFLALISVLGEIFRY
jgi:hypothetical protein